MIIEMGISILGRVNEKLRDERKFHLTFLTGGYYNFRGGGTLRLKVVGCDHKMYLGDVATFMSMIEYDRPPHIEYYHLLNTSPRTIFNKWGNTVYTVM